MNTKAKEENWTLIRKDGKAQSIIPGMMFVGREECDVILQSASADKRHAVIFFDSKNKELHIKDLNSLTGTYVNGIRIPEQTYVKLKAVDTLRFGYGPDIFTIQNVQGIPQSSPSHKASEKAPRQIFFEKIDPPANDVVIAKDEPIITKGSKRTTVQEPVESLRNSSGMKSLESEESNSVSPAFSSLTFRKPGARSSISPIEQIIPLPHKDEHQVSKPIEKPDSTPKVSTPTSSPFESSQDEKKPEDSPSDTGPLAMAFTVAFDSPSPNKKFNIRDSISKYAPQKAEAERMHRLKEKTAERIAKKAAETEVAKTPTVELRKKRFVNERNSLSLQASDNKAAEPKLSNGATYLIEKMFLGGAADAVSSDRDSPARKSDIFPISPVMSSCSPTKEEDPTKAEDCKSDTGTYTIDEELNNKIVKEARQKIDEVFGISVNSKEPHEKQSVTLETDKTKAPVKCSASPSSEGLIKDQKSDKIPLIPPIRPKRRLPVPPVQQPTQVTSPTADEKAYLSFDNYTSKHFPEVSTMYSTFPKESKRNTVSTDKLTSVSPNLLSRSSNRLTVNNLDLLQNSCGNDSPSSMINGHSDILPHRTSPVRTSNWRRSPWHLSGSDMELDQMRVETSSVLSDVSASTEPPSMNPPSGVPGPQMKFNRAFALRRARLGLETELPPASKSLVSRDSKPPVKENSNTNLAPFSRQDGGRFSLRLPRSSPKSAPVKGANRAPAVKSSTTLGQKFGHRRMESDPSKIDISKKNIPVQVPKTKTNANRPPFQRASSFTNNKEETSTPDLLELQRNSTSKQSNRLPASAVRSIPKVPPVVKKDEAEHLVQESWPSKPVEKHELSALDSLVIQATYQLSAKLKTAAHKLLVKERDKFTEDSSERLMINEVLPSVTTDNESTCSTCSERGVSQDLAGILKNLKRVEQSLKVLTIVVDEERMDHKRMHCHHTNTEDSLYVVDM